MSVQLSCAENSGHSDKKMLCPALPTDSCDSWIKAWTEEFSHLQLSPICPAWAAHCSLQRWQQLLAKIQKTDVFHSSLASRTGCTHSATDSTDFAACSEAENWMPVHPKQYFPADCHHQETKDNMPIAIPPCPVRWCPCEPHRCLNMNSCSLYLRNRHTQETILMKLLSWVHSTLQCAAISVVVRWIRKLIFFYQVIFRAGQFSYQHIGLAHSRSLCTSHCAGRLRTGSSLLWHCLPAPHAGSFTELLSLPSASWKYQPSQGKESAVCKQKALGRSHSAAVWQYWRSLAGGNNVGLMVSTICIYINSNEYFRHIHALC